MNNYDQFKFIVAWKAAPFRLLFNIMLIIYYSTLHVLDIIKNHQQVATENNDITSNLTIRKVIVWLDLLITVKCKF